MNMSGFYTQHGCNIPCFRYFPYVYAHPLDHPRSSAEHLRHFIGGKAGRYYQLTTIYSYCLEIKKFNDRYANCTYYRRQIKGQAHFKMFAFGFTPI
jgi:hypothetical protein